MNIDDTGDTVITILSARRPDLLELTLSRFPLKNFKNIISYCNGGDKETIEVFRKFNLEPLVTEEFLYIGSAVTLLSEKVKETSCKFWLHLEDDWLYKSKSMKWLDQSKEILQENSHIFQVRLRHISEKVLPHNMVTKKRIKWKTHQYGKYGEAHFTHNPSLIRVNDIDKIFPESYERRGQKNAWKNGLRTIFQLDPGCFFHTGGGDKSLKWELLKDEKFKEKAFK